MLLVTQSLIASWNYMHDCFESCEESAYEDFINALNRVPKPATPEMQNGIDFEDEVYRVARGEPRAAHPEWEQGINAVAQYVIGAPTQLRVEREMRVEGEDILVYGILDVLKAGHIYDVKFCNKSFGSAELAGKYLNSPQHPAYLYAVPEAIDFTYLVSDGTDLYTENYTRENSPPFEKIMAEFLASIKQMGLMDVYKEHWTAKE